MMMAGVFDEVKASAARLQDADRRHGVEDIAIDTKGGLVFLSATDRRAIAQGKPSKADGIYTASLAHPEAGFARLAGAPEIFHPHGISLFRAADGSLTLMAVNHLTADHSAVDIFDVAKNGRRRAGG